MPAATVAPESVPLRVTALCPSSDGPVKRSCAGCCGASMPSTEICGAIVTARASWTPGSDVGAGAALICAWNSVRTASSRMAASMFWNIV